MPCPKTKGKLKRIGGKLRRVKQNYYGNGYPSRLVIAGRARLTDDIMSAFRAECVPVSQNFRKALRRGAFADDLRSMPRIAREALVKHSIIYRSELT